MQRHTRADFGKTDYVDMIRLMGRVRDEYIFESQLEASAFIAVINAGQTEGGWELLVLQERSAFKVTTDPAEFMRNSGDSGWCVDEFLPETGLPEAPSWEKLPLLYLAFTKKMLPVDPERDRVLHEGIERAVLRNYTALAIRPDDKCHIGHLLHGLVAIARNYSREWSRDIEILDLSDSKRERLLHALQQGVSLLLAVVCSKAHWALAVVHDGTSQVVIYDGQRNQCIEQKVLSWSKDAFHPEPVDVIVAEVPIQDDQHTCGHRVLLSAEYIIRDVMTNPAKTLPLILPEDLASRENIERLTTLDIVCDARSPGVKLECKRVKMETATNKPTKRLKVDTLDTPPRRSVKRAVEGADSPTGPAEALLVI